jgi:hypothetical protein
MTEDEDRAGFSLRRWSRRKLAHARAAPAAQAAPPTANAAASPSPAAAATAAPAATTPATPSAAAPATPSAAAPATPSTDAALPPVESLTFDSDFTAFLQPKVDAALKRSALRTLFRDPRFNVMDGLDTYIDDYTKPDPISPEMVRELAQSRYLFDPPRTRVNAQGHVEDVPPDEDAVATGTPDAEVAPANAATGAASPAALESQSDDSNQHPPLPQPTERVVPAAAPDAVATAPRDSKPRTAQ